MHAFGTSWNNPHGIPEGKGRKEGKKGRGESGSRMWQRPELNPAHQTLTAKATMRNPTCKQRPMCVDTRQAQVGVSTTLTLALLTPRVPHHQAAPSLLAVPSLPRIRAPLSSGMHRVRDCPILGGTKNSGIPNANTRASTHRPRPQTLNNPTNHRME